MKTIRSYQSFVNEAKKKGFDKFVAMPDDEPESFKDRLLAFYNIKENHDETIIELKSGEDFPYKLVKKDGKFKLYQQFSERSYMKPKWQSIKTFEVEAQAYEYLVKKHNKASEYMGWKKI